MNQLLHSFGRPVTTPDARVLCSRCEAHKAIRHFASITFYGKLSIPGAKDYSTSNKQARKKNDERMGGEFNRGSQSLVPSTAELTVHKQ